MNFRSSPAARGRASVRGSGRGRGHAAHPLMEIKVPRFDACGPRSGPQIPSRLRIRLPSLALLFAWLCANGALLDVVQVFAWARMFSGYAETMSVATALRKTFDPTERCELCAGVAAARESTPGGIPPTVEHTAGKLLLALHRPAKIVLTPPATDWPPTLAGAAPTRRDEVPVPPPRV